jgi:hypothetical protein
MQDQPPTMRVNAESNRLRGFATFFKNYMSTSALVTASLPIPVASFHLLPIYAAQSKYLATYSSLFCFLLLSYIFFIRHPLGKLMFGDAFHPTRRGREDDSVPLSKVKLYEDGRAKVLSAVPLILIVLALMSVLAYHYTLSRSLDRLSEVAVLEGAPILDAPSLLQTADLVSIPYSTALSFSFLGIFGFSEAAFIIMALREYLQDLLGYSDIVLLGAPDKNKNARPASIELR